MTSEDQIEQFLEEFKVKLSIWGLVLRKDRGKNTQTLADLEITFNDVKEILNGLILEDYVEGPLPDTLYRISELWVFGKEVKSEEIYIKISMGRLNSEVICISFHIAEHPLTYPYK